MVKICKKVTVQYDILYMLWQIPLQIPDLSTLCPLISTAAYSINLRYVLFIPLILLLFFLFFSFFFIFVPHLFTLKINVNNVNKSSYHFLPKLWFVCVCACHSDTSRYTGGECGA